MPNTKPFVQVACICENILIDKDEAASLIRIVDKFQAHLPKNAPANIPAGFPVQIFIRLGSGDIKGPGKVSIQGRRPDETMGGRAEFAVEMPGGARSIQIKTGFVILNPQNGFYWFDVSWNDELLTSIPAEVTLVEVPEAPATTPTIATPKPTALG
jgi:hypothetical protein